jgi:hypothetical protein
MVVIWYAENIPASQKRQAGILRDFVAAGGRIVVLGTRAWNWFDLCDVKTEDTCGSRTFVYPGTKHSMLTGVRPECLVRWNGLPGTVAMGRLEGPAMTSATKILWVREPQTTVAAEVPVSGGKGTILFSGMHVQEHVNRSESHYDPVAERVLLNILDGKDQL